MHTLVAPLVERWFSSITVARGKVLHRRNAVRGLVVGDDGRIDATVLGGNAYQVTFALGLRGRRTFFHARCTCPYQQSNGRPCKHAWAAICDFDEAHPDALAHASRPTSLVMSDLRSDDALIMPALNGASVPTTTMQTALSVIDGKLAVSQVERVHTRADLQREGAIRRAVDLLGRVRRREPPPMEPSSENGTAAGPRPDEILYVIDTSHRGVNSFVPIALFAVVGRAPRLPARGVLSTMPITPWSRDRVLAA